MAETVEAGQRGRSDLLGRIGGDGHFWLAATLVFLINAALSALWGQWPLAGIQVVTALMAVVSALVTKPRGRPQRVEGDR